MGFAASARHHSDFAFRLLTSGCAACFKYFIVFGVFIIYEWTCLCIHSGLVSRTVRSSLL